MGFVIDLALVAIILLCGWRGYRTGIINGVIWIAAIVVSVYCANLAAEAYYTEFTDMLEPFAVGVVESTLRGDDENEEPAASEVDRLSRELNAHDASMLVLSKLGFSQSAAEPLAAGVAERHERVDNDMINDLTDIVCDRAAFVALFGIAFVLISIIFVVIGNVLDLSFGLPGHENLNHITGAALGVIRGLLIVTVIACLGRYLGILIPEKAEAGNELWHKLVETNKLAEMLNI